MAHLKLSFLAVIAKLINNFVAGNLPSLKLEVKKLLYRSNLQASNMK
jgi:hypothetical protein